MVGDLRFYVDAASVFHDCVVVRGWAEGSQEIKILYDGSELPSVINRYRRDDLLNVFGEEASAWAFSLTGIAPTQSVHHDAVRIAVDGRQYEIYRFANAESSNGNLIMKEFERIVESRQGSAILEIGSRARSGNSYREKFKNCEKYVGIDITPGEGVDIVCDAHHMSEILNDKFDYILSISVFEHLLMPWKVSLEMNACMKLGGVAYIQSHQGWPLHEEPWDFWRFSANAWRGLFNRHTGFELVQTGYDLAGSILPTYAIGGPLQNIETGRTFLMSACIVKKIAEPTVSWNADVSQVYNLGYSHA